MATTPGSPADQLIKSNNALSKYYSDLVACLVTAGVPPEFITTLESLEYDELLRRATQDANGGADPTTAVAVEELHNNVAHSREYAMSVKGKTQLYLGIQAEYTQSSDYHKDRAALLVSLLRGETRVPYLP